MTPLTCPCGSGLDYEDCCGPFLAGKAFAPDPERLMRSRYTAFCRKDHGYLIATLDPEKRGTRDALEQLEADLARTMASTQWTGLKVIRAGMDGPERGEVEFAAFFIQEGEAGQLHEASDFIRQEQQWYYREGRLLPAVSLGRNESCFCGSGRKFKRCHGKG